MLSSFKKSRNDSSSGLWGVQENTLVSYIISPGWRREGKVHLMESGELRGVRQVGRMSRKVQSSGEC